MFFPPISSMRLYSCSYRIFVCSRDGVPIFERLNAEAKRLKAEAVRREETRLKMELKDATFHPKVDKSPATSKIR